MGIEELSPLPAPTLPVLDRKKKISDALRDACAAHKLRVSWLAHTSATDQETILSRYLMAQQTHRLPFLRAAISATMLDGDIPTLPAIANALAKLGEANNALSSEPDPEPTAPIPVSFTKPAGAPADQLTSALTSLLSGPIAAAVETQAKQSAMQVAGLAVQQLERKLVDMRAELTAKLSELSVTTVKIERKDAPDVTITGAHRQLPELVKMLAAYPLVYLHGAAGGGKSHAAGQAAEAFGTTYEQFSFTEQTTEFQLYGFNDANKYVESALYRAWKDGRVLVLDEVDCADANVLKGLNSALANSHCPFPCGLVARHPGFRAVATGNTVGTGPSREYNAARQLDQSFRDRFAFLEWSYDANHEVALAVGKNPERGAAWARAVQAVRKEVGVVGLRLTVTPRSSIIGAALLFAGMSLDAAADAALWRGLPEEQRSKLLPTFKEACRKGGLS